MSSANCISPAATTQAYNSVVNATTCDQFPASSSTLIASIKASVCNGIHIPLFTTSFTGLDERPCFLAQGTGNIQRCVGHTLPTDAPVATATEAGKVA